jgi:hypothetical protein
MCDASRCFAKQMSDRQNEERLLHAERQSQYFSALRARTRQMSPLSHAVTALRQRLEYCVRRWLP